MVKKRLADLLQEEAQKSTPALSESTSEEKALTEEPSPRIPELTTELYPTVAESQKQILDLQATLAEQADLVKRLTKELDDTKQTALKLAESNSQLIEEIHGLKQAKESYKLVSYKKSHRSPERLQEAPIETNDDFAANTWLYD
jgi:hypothetical protein